MKFIITLALALVAVFMQPAQAADIMSDPLVSADRLTTAIPLPNSTIVYAKAEGRSEFSMLWQVRTRRRDGSILSDERLRINVMGCMDAYGTVWSAGSNNFMAWSSQGQQMFDEVAVVTCMNGWRASKEQQ